MRIVIPEIKKLTEIRYRYKGSIPLISILETFETTYINLIFMCKISEKLNIDVTITPPLVYHDGEFKRVHDLTLIPTFFVGLLNYWESFGYCRKCKRFEECRRVIKPLERVLKEEVKRIANYFLEKDGIPCKKHFTFIPYIEKGTFTINIPLYCLFCDAFPLVTILLILLRELIMTGKVESHPMECVVGKVVFAQRHCVDCIKKEDVEKILRLEDGEINLKPLKKYLCERCWKNLVKIFSKLSV